MKCERNQDKLNFFFFYIFKLFLFFLYRIRMEKLFANIFQFNNDAIVRKRGHEKERDRKRKMHSSSKGSEGRKGC